MLSISGRVKHTLQLKLSRHNSGEALEWRLGGLPNANHNGCNLTPARMQEHATAVLQEQEHFMSQLEEERQKHTAALKEVKQLATSFSFQRAAKYTGNTYTHCHLQPAARESPKLHCLRK